MAHAETSALFDCKVDDFFKIISDYERYPEFLEEVKSCKIVETQGGRDLVEYQISLIKTFTYRLWMKKAAPDEISWEFASGDIFKSSSGFWKLKDEAGKTRATYSLEAKFTVFVPGPIAKALMNVNLPNMMSAYHKRVSQLYGK